MKSLGFVLLWLLGSIAAVSVAFAGIAVVDDELVDPPPAQVASLSATTTPSNDGVPAAQPGTSSDLRNDPTPLPRDSTPAALPSPGTNASPPGATAPAEATPSDPGQIDDQPTRRPSPTVEPGLPTQGAATTRPVTPAATPNGASPQPTMAQPTPTRPTPVAPTSVPPTAVPPTAVPTAVPPTAVPPTAVPTAVPPTAVPPTAVPTAVPPTAVPPPPTAEPAAQVRTFNLVGGTTAISFSASGVTVLWATPNPGFDVEIEPESPGVKVEFRSDDHRSRIDAWWAAGPEHQIRERPD